MSVRLVYSLVISCAVAAGCFVAARSGDPQNTRRVDLPSSAASPTPATISNRSDMTKTKQKAASNQARGPVSSQAAGFGVSGAVRDLPTAMPAQPGEPREINPQNTIPIKSVKPANPAARKKKSVRPARGKKPV